MFKRELDYSEEYKQRKEHMEKQIEHNSKINGFEKSSVNSIIVEILTKLTCNDYTGERYIDELPSDIIHQYIQDLGVLYGIRQSL